MKIGEVLELMLEDERKEFEGELDGRRYTMSTVRGKIEFKCLYGKFAKVLHELPTTWILKDIKWDLVRPSVDFMTVYNSGKMFKVKHSLVNEELATRLYNLSSFIMDLHIYTDCAAKIKDILVNGKYYIVE